MTVSKPPGELSFLVVALPESRSVTLFLKIKREAPSGQGTLIWPQTLPLPVLPQRRR